MNLTKYLSNQNRLKEKVRKKEKKRKDSALDLSDCNKPVRRKADERKEGSKGSFLF